MTKNKLALAFLSLALTLSSCTESKNKKNEIQLVQTKRIDDETMKKIPTLNPPILASCLSCDCAAGYNNDKSYPLLTQISKDMYEACSLLAEKKYEEALGMVNKVIKEAYEEYRHERVRWSWHVLFLYKAKADIAIEMGRCDILNEAVKSMKSTFKEYPPYYNIFDTNKARRQEEIIKKLDSLAEACAQREKIKQR